MTEGQDKTGLRDLAGTGQYGSARRVGRPTKSEWSGLPLDPTSVLFVSLFLMLFAFFVVLNSNASERPDGAQDVMESLRTAFGDRSDSPAAAGDPDPGSRLAEGTQLSKAHEKLVVDFSHVRIGKSAKGDQIEVSISLESFFIRNTPRIAPSRELLLKSLAEVSSEVREEPLGITIEFAGAGSGFEGRQRVAALAATLGKYGVRPGRVSIISANIAAGQIRLVVRSA